MSLLDNFIRVFELPPAMVPYVELVADAKEMDLVVWLQGQHCTVGEIADRLGLPLEDTEEFLRRANHRGTLEKSVKDGIARYTSSTFYHRLDVLSMYEKWGDIPADARDAVIEWDMEEFLGKHQPAIQQIMSDPSVYVRIPNRDVLLLDEALAMIDAAERHAVVPCDCRTITMACDRSTEACIRLNDAADAAADRQMGRQLTKQECKELVIQLDREGLMHTGEREWQTHGSGYGFCNCCACDCFPIRAGVRLGLQKQWPRSHYVANRNLSACAQCGTCTKRCQFNAFYMDEGGNVEFDAEKCWGCAICVTGCPSGAISMLALAED